MTFVVGVFDLLRERAVAEQAVERYYATVSQQQVTDSLATLTTSNTDDDPGDPVQVYRGCTDDQHRLLNQRSPLGSTSPMTASPTTNRSQDTLT